MRCSGRLLAAATLLFTALPAGVLGAGVLSTSGFETCQTDPEIKVTKLDVTYTKSTREITFDVAGTSSEEQKVEAKLTVTAYGETVYSKTFNPCSEDITELCPVPKGSFAASGTEQVPESYASEIPSIAFTIPDLDGDVKLELTNLKTGASVGCVESSVSNGKTLSLPAVSWVAGGIAAGALALSGVSALASGGHPGSSGSSPTFTEVMGYFQGMAMSGMLSVEYPDIYRTWTTNFGFSTGLISWAPMQNAIDSFRKATGGNLTDDNYPWLKNNVTLVYEEGDNTTYSISGRALREAAILFARSDSTSVSVNGTSTSVGSSSTATSTSSSSSSKHSEIVSGIQGYVEELSIPQSNTFMTVLLIFAIVVAGIIVLILLFKVILELFGMLGKLPKSLESWRKRYWWRMTKAITNLIFLLYGTWTMYCIYQFTNGDSWAAKVLATVTLVLFTILLAGFSWRIYHKAHQFKKLEGDASKLYEDKETWIKYSLFYDNYKRDYYMFFVPAIVYMFAKGCIIAGAYGHGLVQAGGQLIIEAIFLTMLLFMRPHQRRSGRWINIFIQVVRMLSVACVLVFVEELGIAQTTKTITGVALIVVQAVLTVALAILIGINSLITCIRENPHSRRRRAAMKAGDRDLDALTPLDARNSLLLEPIGPGPESTEYKPGLVHASTFASVDSRRGRYNPVAPRDSSPPPPPAWAPPRYARLDRNASAGDREALVSGAADMGRSGRGDSVFHSPDRQPRLPELDFGFDTPATRR